MKKALIIICFLFLPFGSLMAQRVIINAEIEGGQDVYLGSRFNYNINIQGANKVEGIDISSLSSFSPGSPGQYSSNMNGRRSLTLKYGLLANKPGKVIVPAVKIKVDGKVYSTNPVSVNIVNPKRTDNIKLQLDIPKQKCYVGEPITISLKCYIKRDFEINAASFVSPIFSSDDFTIERIINEARYQKDQRGFQGIAINGRNYPVEVKNVKRNGSIWLELSYSAVFLPKHVGRIKVEPSSVIAENRIVVGRDFFQQKYRVERFMAQSKAAELEVIPLPSTGRPKEAYGLVGNYTISASATPTTVDVGQPITLTVKIVGSKLLAPVRRPEIENMPGFAGNFKISSQREDPVIKNGEKIFTMTIRAASDSVIEVPSIPLVFFSTNKGEYVTANSKPVPLKVNPSEVVGIGDIEFSGNGGSLNTRVEAVKKGLAANVVDIDLSNQEFSVVGAMLSPMYLSLWSLPFAALVASLIVRSLVVTSDAKVAASKRRRARKNAEGMLKTANNKQDAAAAMREYIGWRFGKSSGALTGVDCEKVIAEATGDPEAAKDYRSILESFEAARYTGGAGACDRQEIENAINLISRIDKKS